jgi:NDP-sugar pyrophosphorylase family protein
VLVGRHGAAIEEHVAKSENSGLRVRCRSDGDRLLGTGGAVLAALPKLPEAFWVTYGDTLLSFDVRDAERAFTSGGRLGLMTVLRNRDRWETSNVDVRDGRVTGYDKGCAPGTHEYLDYGMIALDAGAFAGFDGTDAFDLAAVFAGLVQRGELTSYEVVDRFYDVGTVERLRETERVVAAGRRATGVN